ncbi:MAG: hypothetical protein HY275_15535 [Gemmatimonadetes bacterium]|nr:hypothetical protein [Gemmatimonadota bacterium]
MVERLPVEACPECGTPYPTQARLAAEAALIRSQATKPGLLVVGQMLSSMGGGILLSVFVLAAIGRGQLTLFGEQVTGMEFIGRAGPTLGSIGILLAVIAVGLSRNARWTRPLMIAVWAIPVVNGLLRLATGHFGEGTLIIPFVISVIALPMSVVYLYRRENVIRYFDTLKRADETKPA